MNPLADFGKEKIWAEVTNEEDLVKSIDTLIRFREENITEIANISSWYKDNFFIEPTESNICNTFELYD